MSEAARPRQGQDPLGTRWGPLRGGRDEPGSLANLLFGGRRLGLWLIVALLALWEVSVRAGWMVSQNWPPVSTVLATAVTALAGGELILALAGTLYRMSVGYVLGCAAGVAIGIALASSRVLRLTLEPALDIIRPLPVPALIPPLVLFLGLDDPMKISLVALTAFFPVVVNTLEGALSIEPTYRAVAATFGTSRLATITKVLLPATMPYVFAGMRTSIGLALIVAVVGEMIAGAQGIGYYIVSMQFALRPADMFAALLLLGLVGYLLNAVFVLVESRLLHWFARTDA